MNDFNQNHPELKDDEIFVGNVSEEVFKLSQLKTKRLGKQAYNTDDNKIDILRPMFRNKSEKLNEEL